MRTSRISQDTSKIIITSSSSSTTRRTTRSTLSQFAHKASPNIKRSSSEEVLDIEDAISPTRKRQRDTPNIQNVPIKREPQRTPKKTVTVKLEIEDTIKLSPSPKKERKTRKPARQIKNEDGETVVRPPSDWREMYNLVKEMRVSGAASNAAVDTMGCDRLAQEGASPRDRRYHTLTALMLSSQTKDTINAVAMKRLQTQLPAYKAGAPVGLNLENVLAVDPNVLNEMIWVVGFHNNKTKYIKAAAEILRDQYNGDIPDTIEGLMSLPGVGPKMGYLCLSSAWGRTEGIGVDVHVHRITNLWGWHKTKGPEETRIALQSWLPKELWWEINWSLVGLGQKVCLPVGRRCGDCDLGLKGLCKAADRCKVIAGRKVKEELLLKLEDVGLIGAQENVRFEEDDVAEGVANAPADQENDFKATATMAAENSLVKEEIDEETPVISKKRKR